MIVVAWWTSRSIRRAAGEHGVAEDLAPLLDAAAIGAARSEH
jgi:hypothetical protein